MAPASPMSPAWPYTRGAWILITPPRCKCWRCSWHTKVDKAASNKLGKPVAASATWQGERILSQQSSSRRPHGNEQAVLGVGGDPAAHLLVGVVDEVLHH